MPQLVELLMQHCGACNVVGIELAMHGVFIEAFQHRAAVTQRKAVIGAFAVGVGLANFISRGLAVPAGRAVHLSPKEPRP